MSSVLYACVHNAGRWQMAAAYTRVPSDGAVQASDVVITMRCGDACPIFPGTRYEDCELEDQDPAGQGVEAVRPIRDEIRDRVTRLLASL